MTDSKVCRISEKGQFTIPKRLRDKYQIEQKVAIEEDEKGILLKPFPSQTTDSSSLKEIFKVKPKKNRLGKA